MPRPCDVHVHLVPALFEPDDLAGGVAVMIDVLRASTTICTALQHGAEAVVPLSEVPRTLALAKSDERGIAGGERDGLPPEGFDLGNSPSMYTPASIGGKVVYFTTTNGTQALARMHQSAEIFVGCFANRRALRDRLAGETRDVHLVCAGTDGAITAEDVLFAGAIAADLGAGTDPSDPIATQMATRLFAATPDLHAAVRAGQGGQNLVRLGLGDDIAVATTEDQFEIVPALQDGRITAG